MILKKTFTATPEQLSFMLKMRLPQICTQKLFVHKSVIGQKRERNCIYPPFPKGQRNL